METIGDIKVVDGNLLLKLRDISGTRGGVYAAFRRYGSESLNSYSLRKLKVTHRSDDHFMVTADMTLGTDDNVVFLRALRRSRQLLSEKAAEGEVIATQLDKLFLQAEVMSTSEALNARRRYVTQEEGKRRELEQSHIVRENFDRELQELGLLPEATSN